MNIKKIRKNKGLRAVLKRKLTVRRLQHLALIILALAVAILLYSYYDLKRNYDPQSAEFNDVTEDIRSLINIKEEEEVRVAKITDIDSLKEENGEFYKDAKNGQYLVVLPESQGVLIYDKELDKIIKFSTYNIEAESIDESQIDASEKPLEIEIRIVEGAEEGIGQSIADQMKDISANYEVVKITETENEYTGLTLVLLNKEGKPKMSQNIVAHTGTNSITEKLPEGEGVSNADVVLIVGKDVKKIV